MDDLIRSRVEEQGAWGSKDKSILLPAVDLDRDYSARVIALLVERLGGEATLTRNEIAIVADRLALLPLDSENTFGFEVRRLAASEPDA